MKEHIEKQVIVKNLDFEKYSSKGFLMTPNSYGGDYTALGMISISVTDEANFNQKTAKWDIKFSDNQEIIERAYTLSIKKGANALTNISIKNDYISKNAGVVSVIVPRTIITGLMIKRK
jgi:hypothetical protein